LIDDCIDIIEEKQENWDKKLYMEWHLKLVESGLALLPVTQKFMNEFEGKI